MAATTLDTATFVRVPVLVDTKELAQLLRMHPESVTRLYRDGRFTGGRVGKKLLLNGTSVAAYLNERGIPARVVEDAA